MSFLSCIGKRSKKKKGRKQEPIDRRLSEVSQTDKHDIEDPTVANAVDRKDGVPPHKLGTTENGDIKAERDKLQEELERMAVENKSYRSQIEQQEVTLKSCTEEIRRLETANQEMKVRLTKAEAEAARNAVENQKLLQKIVGMEENQAMMSRAELQSMISQLEEVEQRASKPPQELSGIRTSPAEFPFRKRAPLSQEDRQLCWRLCKTEARLSQSMDENKQLREDLKEMLDSHTELQKLIVSDTIQENDVEPLQRSSSAHARLNATLNESPTRSKAQSELLRRLRDAENENEQLKQQYSELLESFENLQKRIDDLEELERDKEEEKAKDTERMEEVTITITDARAEAVEVVDTSQDTMIKVSEEDGVKSVIEMLEQQERQQKEIRSDNKILEKICESLASRVDQITKEGVEIRTLNEEYATEIKEQSNEIEKREKEIEQLLNEKNIANDENKRLVDENKRLSQQIQKRKDTSSRNISSLENIERELTDIKHKYEEANRRLKEYAGLKPAQPMKSLDLNSMTPTTLAERFRSELYGQQWRSAVQTLTSKLKKDEKKAFQILAEICTEAYLFCKRAARTQMDAIVTSLVTPTTHHYRSGQSNKRNGMSKSLLEQLPEDLRRRLAHFRCRPSDSMVNSGVHDFLNQIDYDRTRFLRHVSERDFNEIMTYISTCFEISWSMAVQDPPMYLLFKVKYGHDIDPNMFERYQHAGKRVDYIIWPAVFAEEGGACLQKGVCYALPERS